MGAMRENIRVIAKKIGIYYWIRTKKDLAYRKARDSKCAIWFSLNCLFHDRRRELQLILKEFDSDNILGHIESELAKDAHHLHGASCPLNLKALYSICRIIKPKKVVETGVASGASSFVILSALNKNNSGHLYSIDLPPRLWESVNTDYREIDHVNLAEGKTSGWIVPDTLRNRWTLIQGDTKKELYPLLSKLGGIDLFYHDAEHTYEAMMWEFKTVWPYLACNGVLCSDDVTWNSALADFKQEVSVEGESRQWFGFGMILKK